MALLYQLKILGHQSIVGWLSCNSRQYFSAGKAYLATVDSGNCRVICLSLDRRRCERKASSKDFVSLPCPSSQSQQIYHYQQFSATIHLKVSSERESNITSMLFLFVAFMSAGPNAVDREKMWSSRSLKVSVRNFLFSSVPAVAYIWINVFNMISLLSYYGTYFVTNIVANVDCQLS